MSLSDLERTTPSLNRVVVRNYKSIGEADIRLGAFTILVGRNGAGKSNFLDSLYLIADGLRETLSVSIRKRGGFHEILRQDAIRSREIYLRLEIAFPDRSQARYTLALGGEEFGGMKIQKENLTIDAEDGSTFAYFEVSDGENTRSSLRNMPPASPDRLYLVNAAGFTQFRPVYEFLSAMAFYNFSPETMRRPQGPDGGGLLRGDGSNLANVVARLSLAQPQIMDRIKEYLRVIVPGLLDISSETIQSYQTLSFLQAGHKFPLAFDAASMSDGTLRALAALVGAMQLSDERNPLSLVGIEEPESALHPAAAGALMDALSEAASHTQVVVTSHSPDLLDRVDVDQQTLLAVTSEASTTRIAPIDQASLKVIREHLFTPGELLRMDQLEPDREDLARQVHDPLLAGKGETGA